jgi:amino-acid N-acetyltransferase
MIRKAHVADVKAIHGLIGEFAAKGEMLPRSLSEIYETLRDYFVFVDEEDGAVIGSAALHVMWDKLAEVRSLAVRSDRARRGAGTRLVQACIADAVLLGATRVFALTYKPAFFERLGFRVVDKQELPHKIWTDCIKCSKFPDCDEVALLADFAPTQGTK